MIIGRCKVLCVFVDLPAVLGFFSAGDTGYHVVGVADKCSKIVCVEARLVCNFECSNAVFDAVDVVLLLGETKVDFPGQQNFDFSKFARHSNYAIALVWNGCL